MASNMVSRRPDWIGISSASLCVVHCLATPLLVSLSGFFIFWHEFSLLFLAISAYAVYKSARHSTFKPIQFMLWGSIVVLAAAILLEEQYEWAHELSYVASIGLIGGHIWNMYRCKSCHSAT